VNRGVDRIDWTSDGDGAATTIGSELDLSGVAITELAVARLAAPELVVAELKVTETAGAATVATATCDRSSAGSFGPGCATASGAISASRVDCAEGLGTALLVPIAEELADVVAAAGGGSAGADEDEAGGGSEGGADDAAALVCICGACAAGIEEVTSVGVTTAGSSVVRLEVVAVRARDRVQRLPFTVVVDSWGAAMQPTDHRGKANKGQGEEERERRCAAGALCISTREIELLLLNAEHWSHTGKCNSAFEERPDSRQPLAQVGCL